MACTSVAVPTVERALAPIRSWSTTIAGLMFSSASTSGRLSCPMNCCTKVGYVSLISRCDSFAIVANTSDDLPEPDTPVKTVRRLFGMSTVTFLRLFSRAPTTRSTSWLSGDGADAAAGRASSVMSPPREACHQCGAPG